MLKACAMILDQEDPIPFNLVVTASKGGWSKSKIFKDLVFRPHPTDISLNGPWAVVEHFKFETLRPPPR